MSDYIYAGYRYYADCAMRHNGPTGCTGTGGNFSFWFYLSQPDTFFSLVRIDFTNNARNDYFEILADGKLRFRPDDACGGCRRLERELGQFPNIEGYFFKQWTWV